MPPQRAGPSSSRPTVTPFPAYETPLVPFNANAIAALTNLSENHGRPTPIDKLSRSVSQALENLGGIAADLADHVPVGDENDDDDDSDAEERQERQELLDALEVQARALVDQSRVVGDIKEVVKTVVHSARAAAMRGEVEGLGAAELAAAELAVVAGVDGGVLGGFRSAMAQKSAHYDGLNMRQKYANVAEYVQFRRLVWSAQRGDANMPKSSTWFQHLESSSRRQSHANNSDDDVDSDIEIAQERQSYQCPLTLRTFDEPYTSTVCPHSFEMSAIMDYIRGHGRAGASCPVPGCSKVLTMALLKPDKVLERRVKMAKKRAREEEEDGSEEEEEEEEEQEETRDVKKEKGRSRAPKRRGRVVALSDEDEDE